MLQGNKIFYVACFCKKTFKHTFFIIILQFIHEMCSYINAGEKRGKRIRWRTRMHSSRMRTVRSSGRISGEGGVCLVPGVYLVCGGVPGPGGDVPGPGGVPGPRGCACSGGCTWSQGVYLVWGCTWSQGVYLVLGGGGVCLVQGVYLVLGEFTWSGGCTRSGGTWSQGVYLVLGVHLVPGGVPGPGGDVPGPGGVPGQVLPPPVDRQMPVKT